MNRLLFLAAISSVTAASMFGDVVISESLGGLSGSQEGGLFAVSWTQTGTFSNVSIAADIESDTPNSASGDVYLANKLGSGATGTNIIAQNTSFSTNNNSPFTGINLFSSPLTLGPGTYFLAINLGSELAWDASNPPTQVLDTGVTHNGDLMETGTIKSPAISSTFSASTVNGEFLFEVSGTPTATVGAVPEPSLIGLLTAGFSALVLGRRLFGFTRG
jgi:hypothetical protein